MIIIEHHTKGEEMKHQCVYCHHSLDPKLWVSEHMHEFHYKTIICPYCKRENWLKVNFLGTGHDDWHKKDEWLSIKELEELERAFEELLQQAKQTKVLRQEHA